MGESLVEVSLEPEGSQLPLPESNPQTPEAHLELSHEIFNEYTKIVLWLQSREGARRTLF